MDDQSVIPKMPTSAKLYLQLINELLADPNQIKWYSKENCKWCLGKGIIERDLPNALKNKKLELCQCVKQKIKKEVCT